MSSSVSSSASSSVPEVARPAAAPDPALARGPVFAIACAVGLVLSLTAGRYGYWGDELYYLAAGQHLTWGYADQPPLVPLIALAMNTIAPGDVVVFRLPAILVTVAGVVVAALIAREMGGGRRAQSLAAGCFATCTEFLGTGHYVATHTFDPFLWSVLLWLIVRWMRTRADRLLVWAGVVTAVAVNVKFLVPAFWLVAAGAMLVFGPREMLRRPMLWVGAAIAAASAVPTLVWQAKNGWPQIEMGHAIAIEVERYMGGRLVIVPMALLLSGVVVGLVLLLFGLWRLVRSAELRPYRFLGWTTIGLTVLFVGMTGRYYYLCDMFPVCWAAAGVEIERTGPAPWWRWLPTWPMFLVTGLVSILVALPVYPVSWLAEHRPVPHSPTAPEEIGWPGVARSIAAAYDRLPPELRRRTAIVTSRYSQAGALNLYGPRLGLPEASCPDRGYWYLTRPAADTDAVLFVGQDPATLRYFARVTRVGTVDNGLGVADISQGMPIWLATGRTEPWSALWPKMRSFDVHA